MRIFGERAPGLSAAAIDAQFFGAQPGIPDYEPHPDDASPEAEARIGATFGWVLTTDGLPEVLADEEMVDALRADRPDFGAMGDVELLDWAEQILDGHFRHLFSQHLYVTSLATLPAGIVTEVCAALGRPQDAPATGCPQVAGGPGRRGVGGTVPGHVGPGPAGCSW